MKNLKIGTRLLTGFLFMVVLIVGISVFSYVELRTIEEQADQMAAANAQAFALLAGSAQGVPAELKSRAETSHGKALAAYRSAVISLAVGCTLAALAARSSPSGSDPVGPAPVTSRCACRARRAAMRARPSHRPTAPRHSPPGSDMPRHKSDRFSLARGRPAPLDASGMGVVTFI